MTNRSPALRGWAAVMICTVAATVLFCNTSRFLRPEGERYLWMWKGGQYDFSQPYLGARALLARVNPYVNNRPEFTHPYFQPVVVDGVPYKLPYPPGSLTTLVPIAAMYGDDWEGASRLWFKLSLLALVVLSFVAWRLVAMGAGDALPWTLALVFLFCLALDPGAAFALERGQAEVVTAALCWGAVLLALRGSFGSALFLAVWAASIKGYAILLAGGLSILAFDRRAWKSGLAGIAAAAVCFVLPCAAWLGDAWHAASARAAEFEPLWFNHSFRHIAQRLAGPDHADAGKRVLVAVSLSATALTLVQTLRAFRRDDARERVVSLTAFGVCSLGAVLGYSDLSVTYNFVLLTPGLLVLGASVTQWAAPLAARPLLAGAFAVATLVMLWLCFVHRLGGQGPFEGYPASALGLLLFFVLALAVAIPTFRRSVSGTSGHTQ